MPTTTFANGEVKELKEVREVKAICFTDRSSTQKVGCSKFESKIRYKKWCYFGAAKLLIFNTLIYEIVL